MGPPTLLYEEVVRFLAGVAVFDLDEGAAFFSETLFFVV